MTRYIYGGANKIVGRFGPVVTGEVLELTDAEVLAVTGNADYAPVPTATKTEKVVAASGALSNDDSGKVIRLAHTEAITLDLPEEPELGVNFDLQFTEGATDDVTVDPGEEEIAGEAGSLTLAAATNRVGLYWNGALWALF